MFFFFCFLFRYQHQELMTDTVGRSSVMNHCSSCHCTYLRKTGQTHTSSKHKHTQTHKCSLLFCFLTWYLFLPARSVDILELSEQRELLKFHYHTLRLYSAICALGNNRVAHALCSHVDESQLLQAIENKYMPGK